MKKVKIGIMLDNEIHGQNLIRRLAEIAPGLEFIIGNEGDFTVSESIASEYFPVDRLTEKLAEELGEGFISLLRGSAGGGMRTYLVRSGFGGCGCTALGLTAARILAGISGGRVAFISLGSEKDLMKYVEGNPARRTSRELSFMLRCGLDADTADYAAEDRYGVWVFAAGGDSARIVSWLKQQNFCAVVTDAGNSREGNNFTAQSVINIECEGDCRGENFMQRASEEIACGSQEYYVLNKSPYRMSDGHFFRIPRDETSFMSRGDKIEIAMDKAYAAAVREIITTIEKDIDDGQSDFYK